MKVKIFSFERYSRYLTLQSLKFIVGVESPQVAGLIIRVFAEPPNARDAVCVPQL